MIAWSVFHGAVIGGAPSGRLPSGQLSSVRSKVDEICTDARDCCSVLLMAAW